MIITDKQIKQIEKITKSKLDEIKSDNWLIFKRVVDGEDFEIDLAYEKPNEYSFNFEGFYLTAKQLEEIGKVLQQTEISMIEKIDTRIKKGVK